MEILYFFNSDKLENKIQIKKDNQTKSEPLLTEEERK